MGSGVLKKQSFSRSLSSPAWGLPPQMISEEEKQSKEWGMSCMDYFDYQSSAHQADRYEDIKRLNIISGDFNIRDYKYSTDPLKMMTGAIGKDKKDMMRDDIVHYPIMVRPINTIIGEYISRISQLHGFYAKNESNYAKNQYLDTKTEMLQSWAEQAVMARVYKKLEQQGLKQGTPEFDKATQENTPESIQDFMDRDYVDIAESVVQTLMKNIWKQESLDSEFIEGFKYATVVAKEFYHIYTVNGKTKIKNLSPLDVFYHKSPHIKWIADGQYAGFRLYMTPSALVDMFYDKLTVQNMKDIEEMINPNVTAQKKLKNQKSGAKGITYDTTTYLDNWGNINEHQKGRAEDMISSYQRYGSNSIYNNNYGMVKMVRAYWKSQRQIGWLTSYDDNDEETLELVDQNYKPDIAKGEYVSWTVCNQIYTGAKIGNDIYLDIGPYQDQIIDLDNLEYSPLPIEGCTSNDTGSKPYSLVDLMIPWNELYNIVAYELREDINASIGKVMFMSVDHIPNIPGFDMDKWYYWAKKFKIAWVKQPQNKTNTFNQFSAADMSFAQQMQAKMDALERIKIECDSIAGFSPNRVAAATNQAATLGQASQQLVASVNQTEYIFYKHSKLIERVLNQAMNLARKSLKTTTFLRNLFDDYQLAYIDYDPDLVANAKIGIYVTNSADDQRKRQAIESLMQPAMQNGADLGDMSEMILSETIGQIRAISNKLRRKGAQNVQAAQKAQADELQFKKDIETRKLDDALTISRERNEASKEETYMKTFMMQKDNLKDEDANGIADIAEWKGLDIKEQDMLKKHGLKHGEMMFKERQHNDEMTMRRKELAAEERRTSAMKTSKAK